jgi:mannosyltransferase OCH1-like enzyme
MFNKNIFICWLQGQEHLNTHPNAALFNENLKNWKLLNPDWNVKLISDTHLRNACKIFSKECLVLYDSFDLIHLKIDLGRYVMVYLYGGMYVDMDMYVLRSLKTSTKVQSLLDKASEDIHVLGLSTLNLDFQESFMFIGRPDVINNAMMITTKKNPLLFLAIKTIISKAKKYSNINSYSKIQNSTGPVFINKFFAKFIDNSLTNQKYHIELLPHYYFEPSPPHGYSDIREETIAIHKMELSWIPSHVKTSIKFYYTIKPLIIPIVLPFVIIYFINISRALHLR